MSASVDVLLFLFVFAVTAVTLLFFLTAVLTLSRGTQPGALPFAVLTVLLALMAALLGVDYITRVELALFAVFQFSALTWLVLTFEYTGRGPVMTERRIAAIAGFGLFSVLMVAVGLQGSEPIPPIVLTTNFVLQSITLGVIAYGILLVGQSALQYDDLPRRSVLVLSTAGVGLFVLSFIRAASGIIPVLVEQYATVTLLAIIAIVFVAVQTSEPLFERSPRAGHLARETVLEEMTEPVIIADREHRLLDCNQRGEQVFGIDRTATRGQPVTDVVGFETRADTDTADDRPVTLETEDGRRQFDVTHHRLTTGGGETIGQASLLYDVTEPRTREQRVAVLNRVLRHNLRNDLDAVQGFAEALEHDAADEPDVLAERIHTIATELAALGTMVARFEQLLARETLTYDAVEVCSLVRDLAETCERTLECPDAVTVRAEREPIAIHTDEQYLAAICTELLENALRHVDHDEPNATVTLEHTDGGVSITIADDGPGIPEQEREVLLEGEETSLRHGSGLGLWFVYWCTTRLGGDLAFTENQPRGSVVSVTIPDAAHSSDGRVRRATERPSRS